MSTRDNDIPYNTDKIMNEANKGIFLSVSHVKNFNRKLDKNRLFFDYSPIITT